MQWIGLGETGTGASPWLTSLGVKEKILWPRPSQIPLPSLELEGQGHVPQLWIAWLLWLGYPGQVLSLSGIFLYIWVLGVSAKVLFLLVRNCWVGGTMGLCVNSFTL